MADLCDAPALTVGEQVVLVMARLIPHRAAIRRVVADIEDADSVLQVVRYFGAWLAEDKRNT